MSEFSAVPPFMAYFMGLGQLQGTAGPIGEITAYLARGEDSPEFLRELYARHDRESEPWFLGQRIDLFLGYVQHCLGIKGRLLTESAEELRRLQILLRLPEGAYIKFRPAEVAAILREQLENILLDSIIDDSEDLYQVQLQSLFGLGYDDYLRMTRVVFERVWNDLQYELSRSPSDQLYAKISALEPIVKMALAQPRSLGALHT